MQSDRPTSPKDRISPDFLNPTSQRLDADSKWRANKNYALYKKDRGGFEKIPLH